MVQKGRSKEVWLIPKRGSLHQTVCIIEAILDQKLHKKTWNPAKQNNIGNALRKRGAVRSAKTISNQSIRTLVSSMPQYFGFLYIDNSTTPNTIVMTEAGKLLYNHHKSQLKNIVNLGEGKRSGSIIETSDIFLHQFEKLQITNPIILKDCENILVFPFRLVLKLLLSLDYLDREELAYLVFSIRDESEIPLYIHKIRNFRQQNIHDRKTEIDIFKGTQIGHITLVKAPSAGYFESMCVNTGIIDRISVKSPNPGNINTKVPSIKIKPSKMNYVKSILTNKYKDANTYEFGDNKVLWIDYFGDPTRLSPPRDGVIKNIGKKETIVLIKQNGLLLAGDLLEQGDEFKHPFFLGEFYEVICLDTANGNEISKKTIQPILTKLDMNINLGQTKTPINKHSLTHLKQEILDHSASSSFSSTYSNYLVIIESITGENLLSNKNLRGARYEYLFYLLLEELKKQGIIDDVYWHGKIRNYGLPVPSPGGIQGRPDIVFTIDNEFFILELTTQKSKSGQWSAEGSSVPDHLKVFYRENGVKPYGIYSAPIMHQRVIDGMKSNLVADNISLKCIDDDKLLSIFMTLDRSIIKTELMKSN